jgi:hypothetical protein
MFAVSRATSVRAHYTNPQIVNRRHQIPFFFKGTHCSEESDFNDASAELRYRDRIL